MILKLSNHLNFEYFQQRDVIIKQGYMNHKIYIVTNGIAEVISEKQNYDYYDIGVTGMF